MTIQMTQTGTKAFTHTNTSLSKMLINDIVKHHIINENCELSVYQLYNALITQDTKHLNKE